jgi:hypothetical protein
MRRTGALRRVLVRTEDIRSIFRGGGGGGRRTVGVAMPWAVGLAQRRGRTITLALSPAPAPAGLHFGWTGPHLAPCASSSFAWIPAVMTRARGCIFGGFWAQFGKGWDDGDGTDGEGGVRGPCPLRHLVFGLVRRVTLAVCHGLRPTAMSPGSWKT